VQTGTLDPSGRIPEPHDRVQTPETQPPTTSRAPSEPDACSGSSALFEPQSNPLASRMSLQT
jgi:hypothetical protein